MLSQICKTDFIKSYSALSAGCLLTMLVANSVAWAADTHHDPAHWSYQGKSGPAHWDALSSAFETCGLGHMQSPINIESAIEAALPPLNVDYHREQATVANNGHTVQVNLAGDSSIMLNGEKYTLRQFHFHEPSENHIKGKAFRAELHLVHQANSGALAVIAVMIEAGAPNISLERVINEAPTSPSPHGIFLTGDFDASEILPDNLRYFAFDGSLTTPPCSEGVSWRVLETPIFLSNEQIEKLGAIMPQHNARPLQAQGGRFILESADAEQ